MARFFPAAGVLLVTAALTLAALEAAGPPPASAPHGGRDAVRLSEAAPAEDQATPPAAAAQEGEPATGTSPTVPPLPADTKTPAADGKAQAEKGAKGARKGAAGGKAPEKTARQKNLEDCLAAYDPATNMTRREWAATCRRTLKEYPEIR